MQERKFNDDKAFEEVDKLIYSASGHLKEADTLPDLNLNLNQGVDEKISGIAVVAAGIFVITTVFIIPIMGIYMTEKTQASVKERSDTIYEVIDEWEAEQALETDNVDMDDDTDSSAEVNIDSDQDINIYGDYNTVIVNNYLDDSEIETDARK